MSLQPIDLNLLKTFDALMETRSVSRAAHRLSLTQPAVSNALSRLRRQLDDPLLVRTKSGMEPTPKAMELFQPIKDGLRQLEVALAPREAFDAGGSQQRFTLAAPDFIGIELLSRLMPRWRQSAPGVTIRIQHLSPDTPARELEEGEVDLAIGRFFDLPARLNRAPLRREALVCLLAKNHSRSSGAISLEQYLSLKHVWVSNSGRRGMVDRWLEASGRSREIAAVVSTYTSAAMLVAESDYGVVVAASYGRYFAERLPLRCVALDFDPGRFSIDMLWHPFKEGDESHRWLRQEILACQDFQ